MFSLAAEMGFELAMYAGVEGETIEVCVVVRNGILDNDLTVSIIILPSSTASGTYTLKGAMYRLDTRAEVTMRL